MNDVMLSYGVSYDMDLRISDANGNLVRSSLSLVEIDYYKLDSL